MSTGIVALVSVFGFEGIAIAAVMPVAATDLNAISNYAVTFTSFTMASLLGMSFAGLWANKLGLAKVVIFAVATLAIGSLVAGFAPNLAVLTVGRAHYRAFYNFVFRNIMREALMIASFYLLFDAFLDEQATISASIFGHAYYLNKLGGKGLQSLL